MPWYSGLIVVLLFIVGCSSQPTIGKKVFEKEDEYIIKGIVAEEYNMTKAINVFNYLYTKTDKYVYLKEVIKLNFYQKNYKQTILLVDKFIKLYPKKSNQVIKYKVYSYIKLKQLNKALEIAKEFLKQNRSLEVYKIIAYIYIQKKDYKQAIKYLKSAYSISHSPDILAQMGDIFFKQLKKPNEAISYYQTHIRLYGCEEIICNRLAEVYRFLYDYDNLIALYKRMYESTGNDEYANKVVYLYLENEEYQKAINFIQKYKLNHKLLYMVYNTRFVNTKNCKDAYQLYKFTKDDNYFFLYSTCKFSKSKKGLVNIRNIIANLEILIKKDPKPVYLNYLGYILIDYNIDPKRGVELVKEALKTKPDSIAFLDSLAWGYYKLKKCKKAYDIISKLKSNDKEILLHKKLIRRCYDFRQNNSKNKTKFKKK